MEQTPIDSRPSHESGRTDGWSGKVEEMLRATWGRILAAVVAIQLVVHVVLVPPVLTLLLTVLAAAWVAGAAGRDAGPRQGALLGVVGAITGLIIMGWFGLVAVLWCGLMVGAGWLGGRFGDRLGLRLPGTPTERPAPAASPKEPTAAGTAWVYTPGKPGVSEPTWTETTAEPEPGRAAPTPTAQPQEAPASAQAGNPPPSQPSPAVAVEVPNS